MPAAPLASSEVRSAEQLPALYQDNVNHTYILVFRIFPSDTAI